MKKSWVFLVGLMMLVVGSGLWFAPAVNAAGTKTPKGLLQKKEVVYVASKDSDKFHLASCAAAASIKPENKLTFASKAQAEKAGYKPCGICCKV
ncbi:MAG: Ada metal-binding domain-containing protein [Candidatus Omnitrophota bacterium]